MNEFGGQWTRDKIEIFMKYVPAYLTIMNEYAPKFNWELLYFDGFAGSGAILSESEEQVGDEYALVEGVATRILRETNPCRFNYYYFVEKNPVNAQKLKELISKEFPNIESAVRVVSGDFNKEIRRVTKRMQELENEGGKKIKALVFIDPYGMSVEWESIASMKGLGIDMWMLVPSGVGANRLIPKNFDKIDPMWFRRLSQFFGIEIEELKAYFYSAQQNLFGEEMVKESDTIKRIHKLYEKRLLTIFQFVSSAFIMENSKGSVMYHFLLASNNATAVSIANDIIGKGITKI